jgi:hypothetical protein
MRFIRLVGVDPAIRNFGLVQATFDLDLGSLEINALILPKTDSENGKTVRKNSDDLRRAKVLLQAMREACEGASLAIAEIPVGSQSARAMASYGICVGVLASCPVPLIQVTPAEVKLAATGRKTATKGEMIAWAMAKYSQANWRTRKRKTANGEISVPTLDNEHLADAVAAIEAGIKSEQFRAAVEIMRRLR